MSGGSRSTPLGSKTDGPKGSSPTGRLLVPGGIASLDWRPVCVEGGPAVISAICRCLSHHVTNRHPAHGPIGHLAGWSSNKHRVWGMSHKRAFWRIAVLNWRL